MDALAALGGYRPPERTVRTGQVWQCGPHRLMCGSSANARDLARLFDGERATAVVTSPPYANMRHYDRTWDGDFTKLMCGVFSILPEHMTPDHQLLINIGIKIERGAVLPYHSEWLDWMTVENGYKLYNLYVWDKGGAGPADPSHLMRSFEDVYHLHRIKRLPNRTVRKKTNRLIEAYSGRRFVNGERKPKRVPTPKSNPDPLFRLADSVFRVPRDFRPGIRGEHPAIFPVRFAEELLKVFSAPAELCFEPFSGSGTSIIAANNIGRRMLAMEVVPRYCEIALVAWEHTVGRRPVLLY